MTSILRQADHIKAVAEGGGDASLDNLRTLCTPCHQHQTERLRGRLKTIDKNSIGKEKKLGSTMGGDIRNLFSQQTQSSEKEKIVVRKKRSCAD